MKSQCFVVRSSQCDNELQHHKYIKREKVNGKWRYWYKVAEERVRNGSDKAVNGVKDVIGYDERSRMRAAVKSNNDAVTKYQSSKTKENAERMNVAGDKALKAIEAYSKTPLGMIDRTSDNIRYAQASIRDWLKKSLRIH